MTTSATPSLWQLLLAPIQPRRRRLYATLLTGIAAQSGTFACIAIGGWLCSRALADEASGGLLTGIVALVIAILFTTVARWGQAWLSHDLAFALIETMQTDIYDGLSRATPGVASHHSLGDIAATATRDADKMEQFYAHLLVDYVSALCIPIGGLIVLGCLFPVMALVLLPFILLLLLIPQLMRRYAARQGEAIAQEKGNLDSQLVEIIRGWRDVQLFGAQRQFRHNLSQLATRLDSLQYRYAGRSGVERTLIDAVVVLALLAMILVSAMIGDASALSASNLPFILAVCIGSLLPLMDVSLGTSQWGALKASAARIFELQRLPSAIVNDGHAALPGCSPIEFSQVSFRYPQQDENSQDVLRDLSFTVQQGDRIAITGSSGSGKTTLSHLLMRFHDPIRGGIKLGGTDLREVDIVTLRQQVAWVPQDCWLFNDTVANNIRLGAEDASLDAVEKAARLAQADEFIRSLPDGYDTLCQKGGENLSGGQRQRIALARAFLKDAPIIVLDEASASLDNANEQLIFDALDALPREKTIITIAHRLSALMRAEHILVLDQGRIVESGDHTALLARKGVYARLVSELQAPGQTA